VLHTSPKPLYAAQAIARRLIQQLGEHMTPEQRRDFVRIERLLSDADRLMNEELLRARQLAVEAGSPRTRYYVRPRIR